MKTSIEQQKPDPEGPKTEREALWVKTPFANLIRYQPSGAYYFRLRLKGKLVRRSLKTDVLSVAKLRLADVERSERQALERVGSARRGRMTFGDALAAYRLKLEGDRQQKASSLKYRRECVAAILKTWPGIESQDVRKITEHDCRDWADRLGKRYSAQRFNNIVGTLRSILAESITVGAAYTNPGMAVSKARVSGKVLHLPEWDQFQALVTAIRGGRSRDSQNCADLVEFLAYGGFRKTEAAGITWGDLDFDNEGIVVRGDPETGTKNWSIRRVPMIPDMKALLLRLRSGREHEAPCEPVMRVRECQKALDRGCRMAGIARITHHDCRHLFATRCIESGVDIPTVSRWLGHKDGGALAMRVYGHLRDRHSREMARKVTFRSQTANNIVPMENAG